MKIDEVGKLLRFVSAYSVRTTDETAATAWFYALDTRITLEQAVALCARIAADGGRINPGTINEHYLAAIRPAHQQGVGRPHLPVADIRAPEREPIAAIGAAAPVLPQEVPEYVAARKAANERVVSLRRAWSVPCPYCHADTGQGCVRGDGSPLRHRPSHPAREDALRLQPA